MIDHNYDGGILMHGDCLERMKELPDGSMDMVLADPPYGTTACKWDSIIPLEPMWEQLKRVIKPNGAIMMTASQPFTTTLISSNMKMFKYELIWNKEKGTAPGVAKVRPMPAHESMLIFSKERIKTYNPQWLKGKPYIDKRTSTKLRDQDKGHKHGYTGVFESVSDGRRYPISVINMLKTSVKGQHPTQKPVALMEYLIKTYTHEGEIVLDFTMGSGTTGVACANLDREFIGIEMDEKYFEIARNRIESVLESSLEEEPRVAPDGEIHYLAHPESGCAWESLTLDDCDGEDVIEIRKDQFDIMENGAVFGDQKYTTERLKGIKKGEA